MSVPTSLLRAPRHAVTPFQPPASGFAVPPPSEWTSRHADALSRRPRRPMSVPTPLSRAPRHAVTPFQPPASGFAVPTHLKWASRHASTPARTPLPSIAVPTKAAPAKAGPAEWTDSTDRTPLLCAGRSVFLRADTGLRLNPGAGRAVKVAADLPFGQTDDCRDLP